MSLNAIDYALKRDIKLTESEWEFVSEYGYYPSAAIKFVYKYSTSIANQLKSWLKVLIMSFLSWVSSTAFFVGILRTIHIIGLL